MMGVAMNQADQTPKYSPEFVELQRGMREEQERERRNTRRVVWGLRAGVLLAVLVAWQLATDFGIVKKFFVSSPIDVALRLYQLVGTADLWSNVWDTFSASLVALVLGSAIGIGAALVFWRIPAVGNALDPYLTVFNAMPRPALAPIFILWFGLGITPKVCTAITLVFFLVLLSTRAGLSGINADVSLLADSFGLTGWHRFRLIDLPSALPSVVAGLRLGVVYSVLGVVVSEMVAAYSGLGQELVKATNSFDMATSFGVIVLMAVLAVVLDLAVGQFQRQVGGGRGRLGTDWFRRFRLQRGA